MYVSEISFLLSLQCLMMLMFDNSIINLILSILEWPLCHSFQSIAPHNSVWLVPTVLHSYGAIGL